MPVVLKVKTQDPNARAKQEDLARRVLAEFEGSLPSCRLLCFLDSDDCFELRLAIGAANRGLFSPVKNGSLAPEWTCWPMEVRESVLAPVGNSFELEIVFDAVVYLHGSTSSVDAALVMTLAHELQHFCQYGGERASWAANLLLQNLPRKSPSTGLRVFDIPSEREARVVAKRVAENICGQEAVAEYIEGRVQGATAANDGADLSDWEFVRQLDSSKPYCLAGETKLFFSQFRQYRPQFDAMLQELAGDPDFSAVDLNALCGEDSGDQETL
jgi:hypothetical protein